MTKHDVEIIKITRNRDNTWEVQSDVPMSLKADNHKLLNKARWETNDPNHDYEVTLNQKTAGVWNVDLKHEKFIVSKDKPSKTCQLLAQAPLGVAKYTVSCLSQARCALNPQDPDVIINP